MKTKFRRLLGLVGTGMSQICDAHRTGAIESQTCIHAPSGIGIHSISVPVVEDCTTAASIFVISHFTFLKQTSWALEHREIFYHATRTSQVHVQSA
jgi:hypothetical protein